MKKPLGKASRCTLKNRPTGLIEPTGTLSIWPSRVADQGHDPTRKEELGEPDAAHKRAVAA